MSDTLSVIRDHMKDYELLCEKYGEKVRYDKNGNPDYFSKHARALRRKDDAVE